MDVGSDDRARVLMEQAVLLQLDRRRSVVALLVGAASFGACSGYAFLGADGRNAFWSAIAPAVGLLTAGAALGAMGVLVSHVATGFAVIRARGQRVELVHPFGLHRFARHSSIELRRGDVPSLVKSGRQGQHLVEYTVVTAQSDSELVMTLSPRALEPSPLETFERRARRYFTEHGVDPDPTP